MKPVREAVTREIIDDLWGAGYTILPRKRHPDPFHVPPEMVPSTRSYQWMHLVHDKALFLGSDGTHCLGWSPVPASRHDGYFMPAGHVGDIEVSGLGLFEKPKFEVDAERQANIQKAQDAADPVKFFADKGFSGSVTVGRQNESGYVAKATAIGDTKTIEDTTAIPRDMVPYIAQIFEERDYLGKLYAADCESGEPVYSTVLIADIATKMDNAMAKNPSAAKWPTLNAIILPYAIQNVRNRIKQEASNGD